MIFRRLPPAGSGYQPPVADEAGRPGQPTTSDEDVTCARYALGEFSVSPRRALDDERPPGLLGGRYEIGRLIGTGGTARVYRAYDVRLSREVAVKIYDRDAVALDQRRRLREMTIQGSISHPGVVALLDSGSENGRTFLVMQLVEGENLAERLLSGPMPAAEVTALADGLAEALAHVHARRVVHRDLKPANVFLSAEGPLIGDFGIAHALDATHITGTGVVPGTAAYLAPEQVCGEPAGPPADVYALGLILLECLTGQREYPGTMVEAAMARLTRAPRIPEDVPRSLAYALRRMTQRSPADRPTAEEVRRLLFAPPPTLPWAMRERRKLWRRSGTAGAAEAGLAGSAGNARSDAVAPQSDTGSRGWAEGAAAIGDGRGSADGLAAGAVAAADALDSEATQRVAAADAPATGIARRLAAADGLAPGAARRHRRLAAAAGLAAAAVAAVSATVLAERDLDGTTSTPAQPPATHSPAPTSLPPTATTPARTGTLAGQGPSPAGAGSVSPATVSRDDSAGPVEPPGKPPKTGKAEPPAKGKGKNPGHD
ncbi:protein kinase [Amycolatopsis sp. NEAU-NG30]|uniref:Protein kinase n=1 Tax=Amycolatopsis melonis TaxID=3156488 RepID=A0ABV0LUE7_9PSEU